MSNISRGGLPSVRPLVVFPAKGLLDLGTEPPQGDADNRCQDRNNLSLPISVISANQWLDFSPRLCASVVRFWFFPDPRSSAVEPFPITGSVSSVQISG